MVYSHSTKAQVWIFDFFVAILIFSSTLMIYFDTRSDTTDTRETMLEEMIDTSKLVGADLMSEGYPLSWTNSSVLRMGLLSSDGRFNQTKMGTFLNMDSDTGELRMKLGAYHYLAFFERPSGTVVSVSGQNQSGQSPPPDALVVQTTRLGVYNGDFIQLRLLLWRRP